MRALTIRQKSLGIENLDTAASLNTLAGIYRSQHRYEEAEALYLRSMEIREKIVGPEHPSMVLTLENYAVVLMQSGRKSEAEPVFIRANTLRGGKVRTLLKQAPELDE